MSKLRSRPTTFLCGSPGTGKTAIAKSLAGELDSKKRLAASFFFDKTRSIGTTDLSDVIPTLARQLAEFCPRYQLKLVELLSKEPKLAEKSRNVERLKELIIKPLSQLFPPTDTAHHAIWVIIFDGLDECEDPRNLELLMEMVVALRDLPSFFHVLISSRPSAIILEALALDGDKTMDLNGLEPEDVWADIRSYASTNLGALSAKYPSKWWSPQQEDVDEFTSGCGGLFQLAVLRMEELKTQMARRGKTLKERFSDLLRDTHGQAPTLEAEYTRILRNAYPEFAHDHPKHDHDYHERYRKLVGALLSYDQDSRLSLSGIVSLLGMDLDECHALLEPLRPLLRIPSLEEQDTRNAEFLHATISEYLLSAKDKTTEAEGSLYRFHGKQYSELLKGCLALFNPKFLRSYHEYFLSQHNREARPWTGTFHLEAWKRPGYRELPPAKDINDDALIYALQYWTDYSVSASSDLIPIIETFLRDDFIFFIELAAWSGLGWIHSIDLRKWFKVNTRFFASSESTFIQLTVIHP